VARLGLLHQIEKIEIGNTSYLVVEMKYSVREMTINDYEEVHSLWKQTEEILRPCCNLSAGHVDTYSPGGMSLIRSFLADARTVAVLMIVVI
jgi:hypothetical protein